MADATIAFLGQCHTTGYPGVLPDETFPEIVKRTMEGAKPGLVVHVAIEPYYHPADLPTAIGRALAVQPRVIILEVVGWLAARGRQTVDVSRLPRGVRSAYDRVRFFRELSNRSRRRWPMTSGFIAQIDTRVSAFVGGPLRAFVPRLPRPAIGDFEVMLEQAIATVRAASPAHIVLQGPARFDEAFDDRAQAPDTLAIYDRVQEMACRIARGHGIVFVDRFDVAGERTGSFYQPGTMRPSRMGHETLGHLLADALLRAGVA